MEHSPKSNLPPPELLPLRAEIDGIDHQILDLLRKRNEIVTKVAAIKQRTGFGIRDFVRERDLLEDRGFRAEQMGLRSEVIESLFRVILWASRDHQASLGAEVSRETASKTVAIIGGNGGMGKVMTRLFSEANNNIIISDLETTITNAEATSQADVIVIAVPIEKTIEVIQEIGPHCKVIFKWVTVKLDPKRCGCKGVHHGYAS